MYFLGLFPKISVFLPNFLGDTEEYNLWTLSQAMDYGWMFKIPVWGRSGNGYIFDSDYITPDQAKEEIESKEKERKWNSSGANKIPP